MACTVTTRHGPLPLANCGALIIAKSHLLRTLTSNIAHGNRNAANVTAIPKDLKEISVDLKTIRSAWLIMRADAWLGTRRLISGTNDASREQR
jgi:hypothetical protein